jgi:hypothetical protein
MLAWLILVPHLASSNFAYEPFSQDSPLEIVVQVCKIKISVSGFHFRISAWAENPGD